MAEYPEGTLSPYRVLDLTDEKGFICGRLLGDLGADVIKIEPPGGDPARRTAPFYHDTPDPEKSLYWFAYNTNKRGITLDITTQDGKEIFKKLAKLSHFVIESFAPGYLDSLDLGYQELARDNPGIILTSITAFGQTGPKAHYRSCDLVHWASGAEMYCSGDPDRAPVRVTFPQSSLHAGCEAAVGSLIAHYYRQTTGEGQHVDISTQEAVIETLMDAQEMWDLNQFIYRRGGAAWVISGRGIRQRFGLPCKDGYVACWTLGGGQLASVEHLKRLVKWMVEEGKAPPWLQEFDWVHQYDSAHLSQELVNRVEGVIEDFLRTRTKKELQDEASKRQLIIAPMATAKDIWESDQLQARGFFEKLEHPELGEGLVYCGPFAKLSLTPVRTRRRAPSIGEHNREIYEGLLGISRGEVALLKQAGVI